MKKLWICAAVLTVLIGFFDSVRAQSAQNLPVPGYEAPQETIGPAERVAMVIGSLLAGAWAGSPAMTAGQQLALVLEPVLARQATDLAAAIAPGVPGIVMVRGVIAWTQLFGMVSFELFGQLVGSVDPSDAFFAAAVEQMADFVGIPAG